MNDDNAAIPSQTQAKSQSTETFDAIGSAKYLLRTVGAGALATLAPESGFPFSSLTVAATDHDGTPIILASALSAHSRHMASDSRVSLLLAQRGKGDPLAHPRLTLTARAARETDPRLRARLKSRFLARHPKSAFYADFGDFSFWRLAISGARLNGGFAKAADIEVADLLTEVADAQDLIDAEQAALTHLNIDHAKTLALFGRKVAGSRHDHWRATGLDPEGLDLAAGEWTTRLCFPERITRAADLRSALMALADVRRRRPKQ